MRRTLYGLAGAAAALALAVPSAQAATTKFTFEDVTFPDGQTGFIYASTKEMNKKPDNVYCGYQTSDYQDLGYYLEFLDDAPDAAEDVLAFCVANYEDRVR